MGFLSEADIVLDVTVTFAHLFGQRAPRGGVQDPSSLYAFLLRNPPLRVLHTISSSYLLE